MQHRDNRIKKMVIAALLIAIGILIPIISPLKIVLEPASFTLASHVPVFIAVFISPLTALAVSVGSALGFLLAGLPLVVTLRALSHVLFAVVGAYILKRRPQIMNSVPKTLLFGLLLAVIHAVGEVGVVMPFYFGQGMGTAYYAKGFVVSVILLVGVGTIVHSFVDYLIALLIWKPLKKVMN